MGFNTVVFLYNDYMGDIKKCPNALAYLLSHPPSSFPDAEALWKLAMYEGRKHSEPGFSRQAVQVQPTFHADNYNFFFAGQNKIEELTPINFAKQPNGNYKVTFEIDESCVPMWARKTTK